MALALALICLGGSFAFADDEGNGRSMRGGAAPVADPSSMDDWAVILGGETPNTANIGRIWTDKTVSTDTITTSSGSVINHGDSAFITALSALSSTSNVKSSSTTPLDIVLVLDASGSMDDSMDDGTKRIDALKSAANNFVNHIAEQNQGISDSSKQHQVSIVKFSGDKSAAVGNDTYYRGGYKYNYSQVMKAMSPCTDAAAFRNTINSINPAGSTRADYGLQLADSQTSNREDAKKIVIFFTDGSPTSSSGFESEVASSAVSAAKAMKDKKATVYTVGIFSGADPSADPSGASNENKFMHAVSSNYPEAAYTQNSGFWGGWDWNLGTRPDGSDFYKSATNADELKKVFDDISSEIVKGSGYPTNATEGAEHTSGYITFDDALGAYMQVDSFKAIALNGQTFENPTKTTAGNVDTYTFDGTVAMGDKSVSLGNVVITVTKSTDLAVGDKVQVKVPAALIPLRSYNVDQKSMTMTVSDTKPINVVYTSSLKPGVESLLANPDDAMSEYLQANSQEGKASFYSNDWKQGYLGNTIANFEPSSDNIYYYFTSDTPIYTDEACTQRAHQVVEGNTYWYKYSYYEMTDAGSGTVEEKEKVISFDGADAEAIEGSIGVNNQGAYFKAGTARLTYLNNLYKAKDKNATGTANDVLNPKWVGAGQVGAYLGNNGKLSVDLPGTLAVTKELKVPDGYSANDFADDSFEFTVAMPDGANKSFSAVVKNASGEQQGDAFTLQFNNEGKATHSLKAGEKLYVYGLDGGWNYEVSEADHAGFTQDGTGLKGVIVAGQTANAKVVNSYTASGEVGISATKSLSGRDLTDGEFSFALKYANGSEDVATATNDANGNVNFGAIKYTTEGLAKLVTDGHAAKTVKDDKPAWNVDYVAYEKTDSLPGGVSAQTQPIPFTVTVVDNGDGTLAATANTGNGLEFKNAYSTGDPIEVGLSGVKILKAGEGLTPASIEGKFTFTVTSDDAAAPMPQKTTATNDANGNVDFGSIKFSLDDLNKALGATNTRATDTDNSAASKADDQGSQGAEGQNGAADSGAAGQADSEQGNAADSGNGAEGQGAVMAADHGQGAASSKTVANDADAADDGSGQAQGGESSTRAGGSRSYTFTYKVTESGSADGVTNDPDATKTVSFKVTDDGNGKLTVERQGAASDPAFAFINTYSVQPADSSVTDQVTVTKQLTGRDMTADEFAFELLEGNDVVATGTNGADGSVALSKITYTKPGTHSYTLREVGGGTHKAGVEYDGSVFAVTATVTDNHDGTLSVAHKVDNDANAVGFTNTYAPAATSVTLGASKVLNGKSLEDGEFSFALEGEDGTQLVAKNDANGMVAFPAIQYSKVGTYQYTLSEVKGTESGVTYDETTYAVAVAVEDDGKGSLVATVSYEGSKAPVFNNTYQEPEGPAAADDPVSFVKAAVSGVAKTGDNLLGIAVAIAAVAAAAAAVAALSLRKKGKHAKK